MSDHFTWWPKPANPEEVDSFLEKKFIHAGNNILVKILKTTLKREWDEMLSRPVQHEPDKSLE